jgi:hypothetical protein
MQYLVAAFPGGAAGGTGADVAAAATEVPVTMMLKAAAKVLCAMAFLLAGKAGMTLNGWRITPVST